MQTSTTQPEFQARQGDVFIRAVDKIPASAKLVKPDPRGAVLAEGTATGHHHRIGAEFASVNMLRNEDGTFLEIAGVDPVDLTHEEHSTIEIPPGLYEVVIQREYTPEAVRQVED